MSSVPSNTTPSQGSSGESATGPVDNTNNAHTQSQSTSAPVPTPQPHEGPNLTASSEAPSTTTPAPQQSDMWVKRRSRFTARVTQGPGSEFARKILRVMDVYQGKGEQQRRPSENIRLEVYGVSMDMSDIESLDYSSWADQSVLELQALLSNQGNNTTSSHFVASPGGSNYWNVATVNEHLRQAEQGDLLLSTFPAANAPSGTQSISFLHHVRNSHFVLVVMDAGRGSGQITIYDSLPMSAETYRSVQDIFRPLGKLLSLHPTLAWASLEWSDQMIIADCPKQNNSHDCGFYAMYFADCLAAGRLIPPSSASIGPIVRSFRHSLLTSVHNFIMVVHGDGTLEEQDSTPSSEAASSDSKAACAGSTTSPPSNPAASSAGTSPPSSVSPANRSLLPGTSSSPGSSSSSSSSPPASVSTASAVDSSDAPFEPDDDTGSSEDSNVSADNSVCSSSVATPSDDDADDDDDGGEDQDEYRDEDETEEAERVEGGIGEEEEEEEGDVKYFEHMAKDFGGPLRRAAASAEDTEPAAAYAGDSEVDDVLGAGLTAPSGTKRRRSESSGATVESTSQVIGPQESPNQRERKKSRALSLDERQNTPDTPSSDGSDYFVEWQGHQGHRDI